MIKARKRITAGLLAFAFLATSVFTMPITAKAASSFEKATSSTVIDSKYSFSPRFIQGVTTFEPFGGGHYEEDMWLLQKSGTEYLALQDDYHYTIRFEDESQKGKVGVWYRNIGEYQGQMLDMKITIADWTETREPQVVTGNHIPGGSKTSYPGVYFTKGAIQFSPIGFYTKGLVYRIELFNHNGERITTSGHMTFKDIDSKQAFVAVTDVHGYLTPDTVLSVNGNWVEETQNISSNNEDTPHWVTITYSDKEYIDFMYTSRANETADFTKPNAGRGNGVVLIDGSTLVPFDTPEPVKSGAKAVISGEDTEYQVAFTVPQQPTGKTYTEFKLTDTLPDGLKYTGFTVVDDAGSNVTAKFTGSFNGETFTLTPKDLSDSSFYFKGYTVTIKVKTEDKDWKDQQGSNGKVVLKNSAKISAKIDDVSDVKSSNEVSTEVKFKITTSTDGNGSITPTESGISGGSDRTLTFAPNAGFKIQDFLLDGKSYDGSDDKITILSNGITISNITKNYDTNVNFAPLTNRSVSLEKWIHKDDVNMANGTPTAIFKIEGTDVVGEKHTYYAPIILDKSKLDDDGYYKDTLELYNLTAGTYTVSEIDTSRYTEDIVIAESNSKVSGDTLICDLVHNDWASGVFVNKGTYKQGFSHNDIIFNEFISLSPR